MSNPQNWMYEAYVVQHKNFKNKTLVSQEVWLHKIKMMMPAKEEYQKQNFIKSRYKEQVETNLKARRGELNIKTKIKTFHAKLDAFAAFPNGDLKNLSRLKTKYT